MTKHGRIVVVAPLVDAEAALGRLAGAARLLPDPSLLVRPFLPPCRAPAAAGRRLAELDILTERETGPRGQRRWEAKAVIAELTRESG